MNKYNINIINDITIINIYIYSNIVWYTTIYFNLYLCMKTMRL